jgi:hypothetical protein
MFKKIKSDKWKLYLFYNGMLIKKVRINKEEAPADNVYFIRVYGKKSIFGSSIVSLAVRPKVLLDNDEKKKRTYWGVVFEKGVSIE